MQIKTDTYIEFEDVGGDNHTAKKDASGLKFIYMDHFDCEDERFTIKAADIPEFVRGLKVLYPEAFTDVQSKKRTRRG